MEGRENLITAFFMKSDYFKEFKKMSIKYFYTLLSFLILTYFESAMSTAKKKSIGCQTFGLVTHFKILFQFISIPTEVSSVVKNKAFL